MRISPRSLFLVPGTCVLGLVSQPSGALAQDAPRPRTAAAQDPNCDEAALRNVVTAALRNQVSRLLHFRLSGGAGSWEFGDVPVYGPFVRAGCVSAAVSYGSRTIIDGSQAFAFGVAVLTLRAGRLVVVAHHETGLEAYPSEPQVTLSTRDLDGDGRVDLVLGLAFDTDDDGNADVTQNRGYVVQGSSLRDSVVQE